MSNDTPLFDESKHDALTVKQLTSRIKFVLEDDFASVCVIGEISSPKMHQSGHIYFELKDDEARLSAVMWRGSATKLAFKPEDGLKVVAEGSISVYEPQGKYQLVVTRMKPLGLGDLQMQFRRLFEKLKAEGLYEQSRKKPIPFIPRTVGIATSSSGAAIQDILRILRSRNPLVSIILRPTLVQGTGASEDIIRALEDLDSMPEVDVIIVGRGGGSYEDLFVFNDEKLARAVANTRTPVISAVGHEMDFTICDYVADLRAATPSDAAVKVTADLAQVTGTLDDLRDGLRTGVFNAIQRASERLDLSARALRASGPAARLATISQRLDIAASRYLAVLSTRPSLYIERLNAMNARLNALSPTAVLDRGYAIVRREGAVVTDYSTTPVGSDISITLAKGSIEAQVTRTEAGNDR